MTINFEQYNNKLIFIPLGGTNEIGINVNLYRYQKKWIMVDCGSGFADEQLPGVDMVVADISFIEKYKNDLLGLIITHSHEDHLGAIQYLWNSVQCPIHTTNYTKNFLKAKLSEYTFDSEVPILAHEVGSKFELGPFKIEFCGLTHSAPEMQAVMIRTDAANVFHTGDWKFDNDPIVGPASDYKKLEEFGKEGITALVCDSTNVFNEGHSGSEADVKKHITEIIAGCEKMVVVTTFASNLARLETIIKAGQKAGRRVALTGRSLHRVLEAAKESGYLLDIEPLVDEKSISNHKRENLLIVATGCQGESRAATAKLATDTHNSIKLAPKDTVIFSSKIIPGNDKKIFELFNLFIKKGVEVITEKDHFVHVSGHPNVDELKKMYELTKPKICVPVHGEPIHLHEHAKLAKKWGIGHSLELENGSVAVIDEHNPEIIGQVENGYLAVDGHYLLPTSSPIFNVRKKLSTAGVIFLNIILNDRFQLMISPKLIAPGILNTKDDADLIEDIKDQITVSHAKLRAEKKGNLTAEIVENNIKTIIRRVIKHEMGKSPMIIVNVEELV